MRKLGGGFVLFLFMLGVGHSTPVLAKYAGTDSTTKGDKSWGDSGKESDDQMDNGAEDDKSDESFEKSEFKEDLDDTYKDDQTNEGKWADSKFKEDQDWGTK